MPGDDAALLTPGRMSQRGKEAGLHTPSKDLLTSPSLSPGVSYSHGKRTSLHAQTLVQMPSLDGGLRYLIPGLFDSTSVSLLQNKHIRLVCSYAIG